MPARRLGHDAVGMPSFAGLFDLSSHALARDALDFALSMTEPGYNVFVLGEDRSGRMDATLAYLEAHVEDVPPSSDWVYLNNFRRPHRPRPVRLPAGEGRRFRDDMAELLPAPRDALKKAFASDADALRDARDSTKAEIDRAYDALRREDRHHGLDVWSGGRGAGDCPW